MSRANEENNELNDPLIENGENVDFSSFLNDSQDGADDDVFDSSSDAEPRLEIVSDDAQAEPLVENNADFDSAEEVPTASASESAGVANLGEEPTSDPNAFVNFGASDDEPNNPFEEPQPSGVDTETPAEEAQLSEAPKGKKEKAPKASKAKKEKVPKTKKEKAPKAKKAKKNVAGYGSPRPFLVLGAIFLLGIIAGNVVAFMTAGAASVTFLACFDVLGLILLAVPALLIKQLRTRAVGLFDVFLALVAAFLTIAAMAFLAQQAQNYGASSKVASNVAVSSFDVRA